MQVAVNALFVLRDREGNVVVENSTKLQGSNGNLTGEIYTETGVMKSWNIIIHIYIMQRLN